MMLKPKTRRRTGPVGPVPSRSGVGVAPDSLARPVGAGARALWSVGHAVGRPVGRSAGESGLRMRSYVLGSGQPSALRSAQAGRCSSRPRLRRDVGLP